MKVFIAKIILYIVWCVPFLPVLMVLMGIIGAWHALSVKDFFIMWGAVATVISFVTFIVYLILNIAEWSVNVIEKDKVDRFKRENNYGSEIY